MTQEDKELLLKDLCTRLPYGVKVQDELGRINKLTIGNADLVRLFYNDFSTYGENALSLPLLRPMSSMTEEEKGELKLEQEKDEELFIQVINKSQNGDDSLLGTVIPHYAEDWANKNHFDYRGLIEKGLALEALEGMYN